MTVAYYIPIEQVKLFSLFRDVVYPIVVIRAWIEPWMKLSESGMYVQALAATDETLSIKHFTDAVN